MPNNNMQTESNKNKNKAVSFKETVSVRQTLHIYDYTDAEVDACWPSRLDWKLSEMTRDREVQQYNAGLAIACPRGLEGRIHTTKQERRHRKTEAVHAVLDEQELQRYENLPNPTMLAMVSRQASRQAVADAIVTGIQDQYAAYNETELIQAFALNKSSRETASPQGNISQVVGAKELVLKQLIGKAA